MASKNYCEEELLKIPQVIEEIKRHLWVESEKAKRDIGFENAKKDWLGKYAEGWVKYFRPDLLKKDTVNAKCCPESKAADVKTCCAKPEVKAASVVKNEEPKEPAKRSAKKYY